MAQSKYFSEYLWNNIFQPFQSQKEHSACFELPPSQSGAKSHLSWPPVKLLDVIHAVRQETARDFWELLSKQTWKRTQACRILQQITYYITTQDGSAAKLNTSVLKRWQSSATVIHFFPRSEVNHIFWFMAESSWFLNPLSVTDQSLIPHQLYNQFSCLAAHFLINIS